jgi:sporulation integral membrane protein YlbJ
LIFDNCYLKIEGYNDLRKRIYDIATLSGLGLLIAMLVLYPAEAVSAGTDGVMLCLNVIVPSLLPFFVVSALVVELGAADALGVLAAPVMRVLFNVSGTCGAAWVLGFIGGYPVGAKTAIALYSTGKIGKTETERLLSFCNNSGPAFILGVVGAGVFSSGRIGLLLYLVHALSSVLIGIGFRWHGNNSEQLPRSARGKVSLGSALVSAVTSSAQAALNISGFVIFFTVAIKLLFLKFHIPSELRPLLVGFIELTSGVSGLKGAELPQAVKMAAFLLGWAGLSVHCQALSFISAAGIRARTYIAGKFLHGLLSAALVTLLFRILPASAEAFVYFAEQVQGMAEFGTSERWILSLGTSLLLSLMFAFTFFAVKRGKISKL